jgi:hypothetical protein
MEIHDPIKVFILRLRYIVVECHNVDATVLEIVGKLHNHLPRLVDFIEDAGRTAYIKPMPGR